MSMNPSIKKNTFQESCFILLSPITH